MKTVMGMGKNRTGIGTSPIDAKATIEGAEEGVPDVEHDGAKIAAIRAEYVREAEPIGSVPPPTSVKGVVKAAGEMLGGKEPVVFLDKLGERAAFERSGVRLYEAFIAKLEAVDDTCGVPIDVVRHYHDEELAHFHLVSDAIERMGGDPTAETPSACVVGVAATGLVQVITDPRTSVIDALQALQVAELTDNDGWVLLIDLARGLGQDDLATEFEKALKAEWEHLASVRRWMKEAVAKKAGVEEEIATVSA